MLTSRSPYLIDNLSFNYYLTKALPSGQSGMEYEQSCFDTHKKVSAGAIFRGR